MITAIVVGAITGLIIIGLLALCWSSWGHQHLPWWFVEHAPDAVTGLIGVVGSIVVAKIVHEDSWSLFFVQLAATLVTMAAVGWPLRRRVRVL